MTIQAMPISSLKVNGSMATPFGHCTLSVARSSAMLNRVCDEVNCLCPTNLSLSPVLPDAYLPYNSGERQTEVCRTALFCESIPHQISHQELQELIHDYTGRFQTRTRLAQSEPVHGVRDSRDDARGDEIWRG